MKKIILLIICFSTLSSFIPVEDKFDIVGEWKGEKDGDVGAFVFQEDGYALIEAEGKKMGGKNFTEDGMTGSVTYTVNYESKPIEVDIIFTITTPTQIERKLLAIVEIIDNNTINLALNVDGKPIRPIEFTEENSIVLSRKE